MPEKDFSQLSAAMTINEDFRNKVLNKETRLGTILEGYEDVSFDFTERELHEILSIESSTDLTHFTQALNWVKNKTNPK